jgi:hypothetical protein
LEGMAASGRRPARMGASVKSPDVGVFVRPGRLPARTGMTVATEGALWSSLRHLQVAEHPLQSLLVSVVVPPFRPSDHIADKSAMSGAFLSLTSKFCEKLSIKIQKMVY